MSLHLPHVHLPHPDHDDVMLVWLVVVCGALLAALMLMASCHVGTAVMP